MRALVVALLPAAAAIAQPGPAPAPAHDALGFPITFNDEIITESDVRRSLGLPDAEVPPITLRNERNRLLQRKLAERVGADLGIKVEDFEVAEAFRRTVDIEGGEAKFYDVLAQQGRTLERWRLDVRQQILEDKLRYMFQTGISVDQRTPLPWRIRPTPREIRIAYDRDPSRLEAGLRVRRLEVVVDLDQRERVQLAMNSGGSLTQEQLAEQVEEILKPRVAQVVAELKQRPFPEVAKERGVDVDAERAKWYEIPRSETPNPAERFLQQAKKETFSAPLRQPGGGYRILYLIDRQDPGRKPPTDPQVAEDYDARIRALRAQKWEALLRLKALDESLVRPERVREELRVDLVGSLKDADDRLRALGLR